MVAKDTAIFRTNICFMILQLVDKQDQILPLFVSQIMGDLPCISGIFVAGVLSGALSTVSSGLSSLAAITFQDFIQAGCQLKISAKKETWFTKGLSAGYGVLCYGLVYLIRYVPGVIKVCFPIQYCKIGKTLHV